MDPSTQKQNWTLKVRYSFFTHISSDQIQRFRSLLKKLGFKAEPPVGKGKSQAWHRGETATEEVNKIISEIMESPTRPERPIGFLRWVRVDARSTSTLRPKLRSY